MFVVSIVDWSVISVAAVTVPLPVRERPAAAAAWRAEFVEVSDDDWLFAAAAAAAAAAAWAGCPCRAAACALSVAASLSRAVTAASRATFAAVIWTGRVDWLSFSVAMAVSQAVGTAAFADTVAFEVALLEGVDEDAALDAFDAPVLLVAAELALTAAPPVPVGVGVTVTVTVTVTVACGTH